MLLLTNFEVHTVKCSDLSCEARTENKSVPETKVQIFSVWNEQLVDKSFIVQP